MTIHHDELPTAEYGLIEGFYGPPWSHEQRLTWIDLLTRFDMTRYVWAAKQEPRHRDRWSEPFTDDELRQFDELARRSPTVELGVALTPGPEASAGASAGASADATTVTALVGKLGPAVAAGAAFVVLSCDDMPSLDAGSAHRRLAHRLLDRLEVPVWIVPTHYCGSSSSPYLESLCAGLSADVQVMWTGQHVVNDRIEAAEAIRWSELVGRPPLVWDNAPVNDAMMTDALHLGPLDGLDPGLRAAVRGVLWNPMEFAAASSALMSSAAAWARGDDPWAAWEAWVRGRGWYALAVATAFPTDRHWAGGQGTAVFDDADWWRGIRDGLPDDVVAVGLDAGVQRWNDAARAGAALAVDALDTAARARTRGPGTGTSIRAAGLAARWADWTRSAPSTFGSGVRRRPIFTQDHRGEFVHSARSFTRTESPVDHLVRRAIDAPPR
ncbi:MAG: hypothetical protein RI958_2710 [Actinomycetota bacterium]